MDIRWLQDFLTVAELGNFTRSAQERNASQAAFSRRIQALETWLCVTLIDRSVFPIRLTPEGERFREQAAEILQKLLDAKAGLADPGMSPRDKIRIALPHALAVGRLPAWWSDWSLGRALRCQAVPGNVLDTVTELVSGNADVLVCFHHAQQPIHLDEERYERLVIGAERMRPYVAAAQADQGNLEARLQAGTVPLLMYSFGTYLGRMVDLILQGAPRPVAGHTVFESDMADTLARMAAAGYGVAWLPDCTAQQMGEQLAVLEDDALTITLSVVAYRDRANGLPALRRLWAGIVSHRDADPPTPS